MGRFMRKRRIVAFRIREALKRWHLDMVSDGAEECLVAAVTDDRTCIAKEIVGMGNPFDRIRDRGGRMVVVIRKSIDLFDVEHRVRFQERDFPIDLTAIAIACGFREATGKYHG